MYAPTRANDTEKAKERERREASRMNEKGEGEGRGSRGDAKNRRGEGVKSIRVERRADARRRPMPVPGSAHGVPSALASLHLAIGTPRVVSGRRELGIAAEISLDVATTYHDRGIARKRRPAALSVQNFRIRWRTQETFRFLRYEFW